MNDSKTFFHEQESIRPRRGQRRSQVQKQASVCATLARLQGTDPDTYKMLLPVYIRNKQITQEQANSLMNCAPVASVPMTK